MVKPLPIKKRWEIVILHCHRLGPKLTITVLSKQLKVGRSTIYHWINVFKTTGDIQDKLSEGRPKITNLKEDEIIKQVSLDNPEASSEQISQTIKSVEISISSSIIRRRLRVCTNTFVTDGVL